MGIDLSGGFGDEREFVFATQPVDPEMRESVNAWIWDDGVGFGLPRVGVEAVADQWDTHDIQVNLALGDGRVVNIFGNGPVHDPIAADGRPRILGAGPLSFELIEPYRHWKGRIDAGSGVLTSSKAQIEGWMPWIPDPSSDHLSIDLEVDIRSAVPPWECGTLLEEAGRVLDTQEEGDLMGGPRFEQLFRATGSLRVGDEEHTLDGGGLRVRRTGIRRLAAFWGHAWQSALFPSGRAFGCNTYPPREDGKPTFNEGYLFEGDGDLIPARVVQAPWLRRLEPSGSDATVVLETANGTTTITGETVLSTFMVMPPEVGGGLNLQQAITRYTWNGETANGMLERSMPFDKLER